MTGISLRTIAAAAICICLMAAPAARAHVVLEATLDLAQEVVGTGTHAPGTASNVGAMGTFTFNDEDKTITYAITNLVLTNGAPVLVAHIHQGAPGVSGGVVVPLDNSLSGTTMPLTDAQVEALFDGLLYANVHTTLNPNGEIRGQITVVRGECSCADARNRGAFRSCVAKAIKKLSKDERKEEGIKDLKRAVKKASCGKKKGPKKAIACCLPQTPENNIVTGHLCAAVADSKCGGLGGTNGGASCFPENPCRPPASPSGAFVDSLPGLF